ncbi:MULTISPECIES: GspE/PulE family protein [Yersinia pseudotuberculosis complex]|uniref:Type IV pilus biosynthesis protein PilQ n=1 Tax=Yersinia pseudotuberculosis serotype O:1b (strain IP 31758) TaxID=349747 RepID=A0A0U1QTG8_YERP3|nr:MULTISPECIES: ATPase, T2SS/T4P/T4SS family [Yersinia pseudotuberculosis complex]ABS45677.1 type IV pilus biosynthesis protein PilQ [Yersinia pseudotuberculosis IP 31758]MCE4113324.1 Flp pilus assembly complex ATPase component TadA [Yersinia pseudotuberculosis]RYC26191.1 pilus assembly protein PilQ [Yersinia pseudotuberculosis]UFA63999.1 Type II secretory pathway ATPase GspE/PulE [Yersinia pseudotuberculosis]WLF06066.1 ATPase, T2SS/T4P/T4SS family [Yersinia pseudotuberculosis]
MLATAIKESKFYLPETDDRRNLFGLSSNESVLYVVHGKETNDFTLSFIERLNIEGSVFEIKPIQLDELREYYEKNSGAANDNESDKRDSVNQKKIIELIKKAVSLESSDIHIIKMESIALIKFRVNGDLFIFDKDTPQNAQDMFGSIYRTMCDVAETDLKENEKQDGRLAKKFVKQCGLRGARVSTTPTDEGKLLVIRLLIDRSKTNITLSQLGYSDEHITDLIKLHKSKSGIVVLSGITGSGKSTTLDCILSMIIKDTEGTKHVFTIEHPPETSAEGVIRTPILPESDSELDVSRAWTRGISSAMRLDPDVMGIGEVRDSASAKAAFRAAMTGHLVITTVHANDSIAILDRLDDEGVQSSILCNHKLVIGLINQSLAKVLCSACKIPFIGNEKSVPQDVLARIYKIKSLNLNSIFLRGAGCGCCNNTGITGRTVIAEVLLPNKEFMKKFKEGGYVSARSYWLDNMNAITKYDHLIRKINEGIIDPILAERDVCLLDDE